MGRAKGQGSQYHHGGKDKGGQIKRPGWIIMHGGLLSSPFANVVCRAAFRKIHPQGMGLSCRVRQKSVLMNWLHDPLRMLGLVVAAFNPLQVPPALLRRESDQQSSQAPDSALRTQ
jgi:hypothetical protein